MLFYYLLSAVYVIVCVLLLLVVLLQQGKGDMAAAFGGGSSQSAFGARTGATVLSKATSILAVLFMLGAMALAIISQRGPGSVLRGAAPPPPSSVPGSPVKAPLTPTPAGPNQNAAPAANQPPAQNQQPGNQQPNQPKK